MLAASPGAVTSWPGVEIIETATGQVETLRERPGAIKTVPSHLGEPARSPARLLIGALALVVAAAGVALHLWYLFHRPVTSDEAIGGLMATQILHGHFSAFYWGQVYGGVEPYLTTAAFGIAGTSAWALNVVPELLAVAAALLTWRVTRRLVPDPLLAVLAGAMAWAAPQAAVGDSTMEWGFRGLTLVLGLAIFLVALRIVGGEVHLVMFAVLGSLIGLGWWSSPEIAYYLLPAGLLLVLTIARDTLPGRVARWARRLSVGAAAGVIAGLPWIWANVGSGLKSVRPGSFEVPPGSPGYFGRLDRFFHYVLPMQFSLRANVTGTWLGGHAVGILLTVLLVGVLGAALALCACRDAVGRALAIGVIGLPFLLAVSPATWFWGDGRYAMYLVPLIAIALAVGCSEGARRWGNRSHLSVRSRPLGVVFMGGLLAGLTALSVANFNSWISPVSSYASGWSDPNGPSMPIVHQLELRGVHTGYANYWVAYRLDLLSNNHLQLTVVGTDPDRWPALNRKVLADPGAAWLFVQPTAIAFSQFGYTPDIQGPGGLTEAAFLADLKLNGIGYRIVHAGIVQAVLPARAITPEAVGLTRAG